MRKYKFTILICLFCSINLLAQTRTQRFGAEFVAGFTASQIDGDASAGYNKLGFIAGANTLIYLKEKSYASVAIFLCQRGAQNELNRGSTPSAANNFSLTLNYIEVPVLFHYRDWKVDEDEPFYRMDFHGGLAFGRLFGSKLQDDLGAINEIKDRLEKNDLSVVLGAGYHLSEKISFIFQYRRSFISLYDPNPGVTTPISPRGASWIGHQLSFQAAYSF